MTITIAHLDDNSTPGSTDDASGAGALVTDRGNLPLHRLDVRTAITGLVARTSLVQGFRNTHDVPLEATYVFPLPDRGAVTGMTMTAAGRTVEADLQERARARQAYDDAIAAGQRASIAEEDRPDVFTMRVGNISPGESVEIALTVVGPLPYEDGEATFRFPLVVAPRYVPGAPLGGPQAGTGWTPDTDAVPDASRISPPVLLPGFPNPVALSIEVAIDAAGLPLSQVRSSLHAISTDDGVVRVQPGERVNRDFVLRLPYGDAATTTSALTVAPDGPDAAEGTFQLTVVPPTDTGALRPKDVVLLLDRSGSMGGWKMVAARRAAARIVDSLVAADRFAVLTFDHVVDTPDGLPGGLVAASDRNRFRAVEHLSRADARGGTEILEPLVQGLTLLAAGDPGRDRVLVLVTDGQVGNEDQILRDTASLVAGVRVHTVGIDQAVNAGFLGRLAVAGGGRCELVESEDRLDAAMDAIHRRIATPLVTGLRLSGAGLDVATVTPDRLPDLVPGVPLVVRGRYRGGVPSLALAGTRRDDRPWDVSPVATTAGGDSAITPVWARSALRDLEDGYAVTPSDELERRIVELSLRFGVLCRFTAFVAVDARVSADGAELHRVTQPVELPGGWEPMADMMRGGAPMAAPMAAAPMSFGGGPSGAMLASAPAGAARPKRMMKRSRGAVGTTPLSFEQESAPPPFEGDLAMARTQASAEADRLSERPGPVADRREALDDLASRLEALVHHLRSLGADTDALQEVVDLLRDTSVPLDERWERAAELLTAFAQGTPTAPTARRSFWKAR